ncbi:hypothetical protein [Zunongwangia sp.]|uniref:hypothetical protein n=1 Tax=Zunongwangia sp. TaxID=1965325 RepID=UPI003AA92E3B
MKNFILIISFIVAFYKANAQESISCEEQQQNAIQDIQNGIYKYKIHSGFKTVDQLKFDFYFKNYLFTKFNIEYFYLGCISGLQKKEGCYWSTMDSLFTQKFGANFIEKQFHKINESYYRLTEKEKSEILSEDKVFRAHELEKPVKFVGDINEVKKYFKERYRIPDSIFNNWLNVLEIGIDGKVEDYQLNAFESNTKFYPINSKEQKLNDLKNINKLGIWKPGCIYGKKVRSDFFL